MMRIAKRNSRSLCILAWVCCVFLLVCAKAQAQQPPIPEKRQHIRQLIVLLGGVDGLKRSMQDEITTLREKYPNLKQEYWDSLTQEIDTKELPALIDRLVATYDTLLTDEEVSEMMRFYESPTGKKVTAALPQISQESRNLFTQWRQALVKKVGDRQGGLVRAAASGDTNKVNELLSTGADVNERNAHGVTPLMAAAYKGNADLAQLLIEKGAEVNAKSNKGSTALMAAVESGNKPLVELLITRGADPNLRDTRGLNAYQIALLRGQYESMLLLKDKTKETLPVEVRAVVAHLGRGKDCLPVLESASDASRKVACLKAGEKVELAGLPRDDGWAMIHKPSTGWVQSQYLKQTLVFRDQEKRVATGPQRSVAQESLAELPASPEPSDEETTTDGESPEKPRIWWRR